MKKQLATRACGFDTLSMFNITVLFYILSVKDYVYYNTRQHFIDCFRLDTATKLTFAETTEYNLLSHNAYKSSAIHQ